MKKALSALAFVSALAATESAIAGRIIDYIRNYDLNDYSIGLAISASQTPSSGGDNSTFGYP